MYFNHQRSEEGTYFKDIRHQKELNNAFETIAFHVPINLQELQIAINYFAGQNPKGAEGELRISVDGETYSRPFIIKSLSGDRGAEMRHVFTLNPLTGKYSVTINPLSFILHEEV